MKTATRYARQGVNLEAVRLLEALRLGVVPAEDLHRFTVGRDREMSLLREDLREARSVGAGRVYLGDYGTGKTHLLECIESEALSQGFLTARVVLDSQRVPPSQPKRVYQELVRQLRYPSQGEFEGGSGLGLAPLFDAFLRKPPKNFFKSDHPDHHAYLSPVAQSWQVLDPEVHGDTRQALLDWIEGRPSENSQELQAQLRKLTRLPLRLYALKDYRPWAHLYSYLVGGLAWMAQSAGYSGLVVLFDEAEFYSLLTVAGREFADLLFGYYAAAALGPERARFNAARAKRGGHAVHRSFEPGYRHPIPLYCAFAMTEDPRGVATLRNIVGEDYMHRLEALDLEDYQELSRRVVSIYKEAYPDFTAAETVQYPMGQVLFRGVESGRLANPRQVLKFILEMLDFSRLRRDRIQDFVKEIVAVVSP